MTPEPPKICGTCKSPKPTSEFFRSKKSKDGLRRYCKRCARAEKRKYFRTHSGYAQDLIKSAHKRARDKDIEFNLNQHVDQISARLAPMRCELSGAKLIRGRGKQLWNSPSIDRIDSSAGYAYANIRIICFALNSALGNWGEKILFRLVNDMQRRNRSKVLSHENQTLFENLES